MDAYDNGPMSGMWRVCATLWGLSIGTPMVRHSAGSLAQTWVGSFIHRTCPRGCTYLIAIVKDEILYLTVQYVL